MVGDSKMTILSFNVTLNLHTSLAVLWCSVLYELASVLVSFNCMDLTTEFPQRKANNNNNNNTENDMRETK